MKRFTVVTTLFSVSILVVWVAFQAVTASSVRAQDITSKTVNTNPASNKAIVPVTSVEARTVAPAPVYDASGRIVSLNPNGSNKGAAVLVPAANVQIAPVYDASGALVSDPTGTVSNGVHDVKIAPVFDAMGQVISDPTGTLLNASNP